jgi:hypothetical protein
MLNVKARTITLRRKHNFGDLVLGNDNILNMTPTA